MKTYLFILLTSILAENFVLSKFLGICPFLGVSKKLKTAVGMSLAVIFVMLLSTAVTYPISKYILQPNYEYLTTLVFIIVIAALVQFVETAMKKFMPPLHRSLGIYLPLITTNCAVLGVTLLVLDEGRSYGGAVVNSLGAGLGFMLAMVIFAGVRERLESSDVPKAFKGLPITLISAALVSMAFLGFAGLAEGLLG